jgi:hypothetical protein
MTENIELQTIEVSVTEEDLNQVNTDQLASVLSKSAYLTLAAIVKQAGTETNRIEKLNSLIQKTEDDLFSEGVFDNLKNEEKIKLYDILAKSQKNSLAFLNKVNENVSKGMEAVSLLKNQKLEAEKSVRRLITGEDRSKNHELKKYIQNMIEEKLEQKKLLGIDYGS